jgi:predicted PurR-regulated permease PerM
MSTTKKHILFAVVAVAGAAIVVLTADVLLTLFAGVLLAIVLHGIAQWTAKRTRLPYGASLAILVVVLLGGAVASLAWFGPQLAAQANALAQQLPKAVHDLTARIHEQPLAQAITTPDKIAPETASYAATALRAVGTSFEVIGGLVVVFFVGVYGAANPRSYVGAALALSPADERPRVARALENIGETLRRWLLGRLVAMLFVGITSGIVFAVLDVPLALILAVFAGLLTFVEYVGAVASAIPPILLAFTRSPTDALSVAILFTVLHVIEGYVLTPLLAGATVRVPPALILAGQVLMAALVGPLGLTFSTPLLVVAVAGAAAWRKRPRSPATE